VTHIYQRNLFQPPRARSEFPTAVALQKKNELTKANATPAAQPQNSTPPRIAQRSINPNPIRIKDWGDLEGQITRDPYHRVSVSGEMTGNTTAKYAAYLTKPDGSYVRDAKGNRVLDYSGKQNDMVKYSFYENWHADSDNYMSIQYLTVTSQGRTYEISVSKDRQGWATCNGVSGPLTFGRNDGKSGGLRMMIGGKPLAEL
jgi:hypothetical protein